MLDRLTMGTRGRSRVISTSKIKKMTAMRKNRREKGIRADPLGSKPHSKGEFFSRSLIVFLERRKEADIRTAAMMNADPVRRVRERIVIPEEFQTC